MNVTAGPVAYAAGRLPWAFLAPGPSVDLAVTQRRCPRVSSLEVAPRVSPHGVPAPRSLGLLAAAAGSVPRRCAVIRRARRESRGARPLVVGGSPWFSLGGRSVCAFAAISAGGLLLLGRRSSLSVPCSFSLPRLWSVMCVTSISFLFVFHLTFFFCFAF